MSQNQKILSYLKTGKSITQRDAVRKFNCYRLGARIWDLLKLGHPIVSNTETEGKMHWSRYAFKRHV